MIKYKYGNLLDAPEKVLIHGANAHGVMGSGVARQIRAKWPNVYEVYHLRYKTFGLNLGDIIPVATMDGKIIVNAITQDNYGRTGNVFADYTAIETCMKKINERVGIWETAEVAMPKIGAGLGGGDWKIIEEIIERCSIDFTAVIYEYGTEQIF